MARLPESPRVRIDKWLWAARFFKTRSRATAAVAAGHAHLNGARTRPGRSVAIGDEVTVRKGAMTWTVVVRGLAERRGPAPRAAALYEETTASKELRARIAAELRATSVPFSVPAGRPTKRDRRRLARIRGRS